MKKKKLIPVFVAAGIVLVGFVAWIIPNPPLFGYLNEGKLKAIYYSDLEQTPYTLGNFGATVMRSYVMPGTFEENVARVEKEVTPLGFKFGGTSPDDKLQFFTPKGEAATHTDKIVVINRTTPVTIDVGVPMDFRQQMRRSFKLR